MHRTSCLFAYLDLSWHSTPLCNYFIDFISQEALPSSHSGAVRLPSYHAPSSYLYNLSRRALLRSQILRTTSSNSPLPPSYYKSLSASLWHAFDSGTYLKDGPPKDSDAPAAPANPLTNPDQMEGMMDGMKKQLVMMVPQMVIMGWINFFFQGFVASEFFAISKHTCRPIIPFNQLSSPSPLL